MSANNTSIQSPSFPRGHLHAPYHCHLARLGIAESNCCATAVQVLVSAFALATFGVIGASLGGAGKLKGGLRVIIGGLAAMGITYGFGRLFVVKPSP